MARRLPVLGAAVLAFAATASASSDARLYGAPIASSGGAAFAYPSSGVLVFACSGCPGAETATQLFTIRPDGSQLRRAGGVAGYNPRWAPGGRTIAFDRESVHVVGASGGERRLTRPLRGAHDSEPAWSPDGKHLVFVRAVPPAGAGNYVTSLRVVRATGGLSHLVLSAHRNVVSPDWSPDGTRVAFNDVSERMWVANVDGSHRRRLGPPTLEGREPRWSPDGTRLAFVDVDRGTIRLLTLSTGRARNLLSYGSFSAHAWSPNGQWLALMRSEPVECDGPYECEDLELWIVSATGAQRRMVWSLPDGGEVYGLDWGPRR